MPVSMLTTNFQVLTRITGTFFRFSHFELSGYNGNNGHVFTKKPELAFRVLTAIKWYPGDGQNYDSSEPSNGATFSVLVTDDGKEEILYTKRN